MANKRKCAFCGKFSREFVVFGIMAFCNPEHCIAYTQQPSVKANASAKVAEAKKKEYTARTKEMKTALDNSNRRLQLKLAQKEFNAFIRLRDARRPCVSCGRTNEQVAASDSFITGGMWDAGHYRSVGAAREIRFNEMNCHKQCKVCNGGAKLPHLTETITHAYRIELIKRIGIENVEFLELRNHPVKHYSADDLIGIKEKYKAKAKKLKEQCE